MPIDDDDHERTEQRFVAFLSHFDVDFDGEGMEPLVNRITLSTIAAERCMLDAVQREGAQTAYVTNSMLIRRKLLQDLWLHDRLDSPWMLLVDKEFPGDPPEQVDFESFAREAGDEIAGAAEYHQKFVALLNELMQLLRDEAYEPEEDDEWVAAAVAGAILLVRTLQDDGPTSPEEVAKFQQQAAESIEEASDPEHPAWQVLLERYFPNPT